VISVVAVSQANEVTVEFDTDKITLDQLEAVITAAGFEVN
jgi:copper chaperone CopZ